MGELITRFRLAPHPEGGWFRRTWLGPPGADGRPIGSAILYLLADGERSHWHRLDVTELWHHYGGAAVLHHAWSATMTKGATGTLDDSTEGDGAAMPVTRLLSGLDLVDIVDTELAPPPSSAPSSAAASGGPIGGAIDGMIGRAIAAGPQLVVERGWWQTARSLGAWSLVGCTTVPAFDVSGFELAPPGWSPPGGASASDRDGV